MSRVRVWLLVAAIVVPETGVRAQDVVRAELAKKVKQSTVLVEASLTKTVGAAFCVADKGFFVTSATAVRLNLDGVKVIVRPGQSDQKEYRAKVVRIDRDVDLALLRLIGDEKIPPLAFGSSDGLTELSPVVVAGFQREKKLAPEDDGVPPLSLMSGQISALSLKDGELRRIQTDVAINSPGGPMVDGQGRILGMVAGDSRATCAAVPVADIRRFVGAPIVDVILPPVKFAERHLPIAFTAQVTEILPPDKDLQLELVIESGAANHPFPRQPSRMLTAPNVHRIGPGPLAHFSESSVPPGVAVWRAPMAFDKGKYEVKAAPVPSHSGVRVSISFPDGVVEGYVPDGLLRIGKREVQLSDLRVLKLGLAPSATVGDEKAILAGKVSGLKPWTMSIGGEKVKVEPEKALEVRIHPPERGASVPFRIVASRDGREVGSVRETIRFLDTPRPEIGKDGKDGAVPADLEGDWVLEWSEENGGDWPVRDEESMKIHGDKLSWKVAPNKRGGPNSPTSARLVIDDRASPKAIDFVVLGSRPGRWHGIWKIEESKLVLAVNVEDDRRPRQFTTNLSAGADRATFVRTYRRAGTE